MYQRQRLSRCSINSSYCPPDQQDWCRQPMARLRNGEGTVLVKASIPHPLTVPSVNMVSWCRSNWAHFRVPLCPHLHLFNRSCFRLRSELSGNSALSHHKFLSLLESQAARLWQQLVDTDCKPKAALNLVWTPMNGGGAKVIYYMLYVIPGR